MVYLSPWPLPPQQLLIPSPSAAKQKKKQGILDTIANLRMALESSIDNPAGNRETRDAVAAAFE